MLNLPEHKELLWQIVYVILAVVLTLAIFWQHQQPPECNTQDLKQIHKQLLTSQTNNMHRCTLVRHLQDWMVPANH